jgi:hypothetical protein
MTYRVVYDEHGRRILRDNEPVSLEDAVTELNAIGAELKAAQDTLDRLHRGLAALKQMAEKGGML